MVVDLRPAFPLRVVFFEGDEVESEEYYEDAAELALCLEFFDSNEDPETARAFDRYGRRVRVKVEARKLVALEVLPSASNQSLR